MGGLSPPGDPPYLECSQRILASACACTAPSPCARFPPLTLQHFTNATATTHIHIHGGGGNGGSDSPQVVIDAGEAPEEAGEEARRRRALLAPVGDAAFPGAAAGAGGVQPPGPGVFLYYQPLGKCYWGCWGCWGCQGARGLAAVAFPACPAL